MISQVFERTTVTLNGSWEYKLDQNDVGTRQSYYLPNAQPEGWRQVQIPHNWYLEKEIGDYFGTIWYRKEFAVGPELEGENLFVRFEGVDYIAQVWLNGIYLGSHEGMFSPFEFEITPHLRPDGKNLLVVRDSAPKDTTEYIWADDAVTPLSKPYQYHQSKGITQIKGHMIEAMHRPGAMTSFRQDGNSGGLWGDVTLVARPKVYINYVKSFTKLVYKKDWLGDKQDKYTDSALASFDVFVNSKRDRAFKTTLWVELSPYNFTGEERHTIAREVVVQPGENLFKIVVTVEQAKLWWTWDHGTPHLYTAKLGLAEDQVQMQIGIKEIYTDVEGQWFLNGRKLFQRGMRYISSLWMSEAGPEMWKADFEKMIDMEINAIRIGSHVERDGLYTLCDELGLLMWQVFPLHYVIDESDDVIDRACDMIRDMGYMLCNHACMGMWSVYKEPEIYGLPDKPNVYFRLCEVLKETLGTVDPIRWIHKGDYREGVQNIMIGSCQDGDKDIRTTKFAPNIVEFGADSVPCLETLKAFIPEDKLWPPDWDTWEYWGLFYRNQFKRGRVEMGHSLEEFIQNTQAYEALVVKEQIETLRQRKYKPVSSMYLYYWSDACAMMGSGLFDYFRRPYQVYESMKSVYTQVLVSLEWNRDPYLLGREKKYDRSERFLGKVWVNNDHYHPLENAKIGWEIVRATDGVVVHQGGLTATLAPDSAEVVDVIDWLVPEDYVGEYAVQMTVYDQNKRLLSKNMTKIRACQ